MEKKQETEHLEQLPGENHVEDTLDATVDDAAVETQHEKDMTLWQGLRTYPKAVGWSLVVAMTVVMDGYDGAMLGSFYGYPSFQEKFGEPTAAGGYQIPAKWQTIFSMMSAVGSIVGIAVSGFFVDKIGLRKLFMLALTSMIGIIFMFFFAPSREVLTAASFIFGIPMGVFAAGAPAYTSQIMPVVLRGYLTTFINACWVIGQLVSQGVLRGCLNLEGDMSWKIPFAIQWVWPPFLIVALYFAPDSPWWLVQQGRIDDARKALARLNSVDDPDRLVKFIIHTNEMEKAAESGTSYLDCFRNSDLRRTEIASLTFVIQAMSVGAVMGYSAFFFQSAGLPPDQSYNLSIGQYAIGLVGTFISWFFMVFVGRRTIYVYGLFSMMVVFFIMGCVSLAPESNGAAPWAVAILELIIVLVYDSTIGPCAYSIVSEISSTRLRNKTIAIARNVYNVWNTINAVIYPYILNTEEGNWKGKVGFFQAGIILFCVTWAFFRLPEPKGRTYGELDIMFQRKVPTRKFKNYKVETLVLVDDKHE